VHCWFTDVDFHTGRGRDRERSSAVRIRKEMSHQPAAKGHDQSAAGDDCEGLVVRWFGLLNAKSDRLLRGFAEGEDFKSLADSVEMAVARCSRFL